MGEGARPLEHADRVAEGPGGLFADPPEKGMSLVELMVALACASLVTIGLYHLYLVSSTFYKAARDTWSCMQSLRAASLELHTDLAQAACLMPRSLAFRVTSNGLFIAGIPVTSQHPGIQVHPVKAPPYYAVIAETGGAALTLDTVDIDSDGRPDFWAFLGVITDTSAGVVSGSYRRGSLRVPIGHPADVRAGERIVPAVHYELKPDGLYRNSQLLAEAITRFEPRTLGGDLSIFLEAASHEVSKHVHFRFPVR